MGHSLKTTERETATFSGKGAKTVLFRTRPASMLEVQYSAYCGVWTGGVWTGALPNLSFACCGGWTGALRAPIIAQVDLTGAVIGLLSATA